MNPILQIALTFYTCFCSFLQVTLLVPPPFFKAGDTAFTSTIPFFLVVSVFPRIFFFRSPFCFERWRAFYLFEYYGSSLWGFYRFENFAFHPIELVKMMFTLSTSSCVTALSISCCLQNQIADGKFGAFGCWQSY